MLDDDLEILLPTYNRFKDLDKTLSTLLNSPFSRYRITILDNCSPDDTPSVCARYARQFANFRVIRHRMNIGGDPNYLRAVELSEAKYTWVIGDDDSHDYSSCADVIEVIQAGRADIICVGAMGNIDGERGVMITGTEIMRRGIRYFHMIGFIPNIIFRTSLYDSESVLKAYRNVSNLFPQMVLANKSVEENSNVYIAKKQIIHRNEHNMAGFSPLLFISSWVNSCQMIKDSKLRRKVIYQVFETKMVFYKKLIFYVAYAKATKYDKLARRLMELAIGLSKSQVVIFVIIFPILLLPTSLLNLMLRIYRKYSTAGKSLPEHPWTDPWSW